MKRLSIAALLLFASLGASAEETAPLPAERGALPTVAVLPFTSTSFDDDALNGMASAMGTELVRTGKFRVMERSQIDAILKEQGFQQSGACDQGECAVEVGRILSVQHLVVGSIAKVGKIYTLSTRMVSVETGETERSVTRNGSTELETVLTRAVPLAARDLAGLPTKSDKDIAEERAIPWGWWVAGGAVLVGGTAAVVLLLNDDGSSATATNQTSNGQTVRVVMP